LSKKDEEVIFLSMKIRFLGRSCIEIIGYRPIVIEILYHNGIF
jgi:hypothetical protein